MRLLALLVISLLCFPVFSEKLVNGTAGTIGKTLITVEDLYFYRALQRFIEGSGNPLALEEGVELKKTLQKVLFEEMVYAEMKSFRFEGQTREAAENLIRAQRALKGKEAVWREILKRFGRSESAAIDRVLKSLDAEKFVQKKAETLTPIITEGEAERYYKQNQSRFQGSTFESLKANIVLLLKKERMQKGLEEWVNFLKEKYEVSSLLGEYTA